MNRVLMSMVGVVVAAGMAVACGPTVGVPAAAVSYPTGCYTQQAVYQQQTVAYAYPLAVLAVPAVTVAVQPAVPASQPAVPAPQPALAPDVAPQAYAPAAAPVIVQRSIVASYATTPIVLNTATYGYGYGHGGAAVVVSRGVFHRGAAVVVRAQRQRQGFFARFRANRAAARAQRTAARATRGVPASTVIIR